MGKKTETSDNVHEKQKGQRIRNQNEQTNKEPTHDKTVENQTADIETVDLTKTMKPRKTIKHATLLTGSSNMLNEVN